MRAELAEYLPWVLSALSLVMAWLTGNKLRGAWLFGIGVQLVWLVWIWSANKWGFLTLNIFLFAIYARNWWKWKQEDGSGWVVADAHGERFRAWGDWGPVWVDDADEALFFARRRDAEAFCAEDEDAWRILKMVFVRPGVANWVHGVGNDPVGAQGRRYERAISLVGSLKKMDRPQVLAWLDNDSCYWGDDVR